MTLIGWTQIVLFCAIVVALTPLLMMWLGLGFSVKVAVVFLFAFFPILINTASGAKNVSADGFCSVQHIPHQVAFGLLH